MLEPRETESVAPLTEPVSSGRWSSGRLLADRYEVRECLGRGGNAAVYRVFDRLLRAEVALKVVHPERDPERALSRLRREVGVARESLSPHLVRVYELGRSGEDIYLTMELLAGGALRKRVGQSSFPVAEALRIADAVLRGLAALHTKGVVHRDVTPGNILFSDSDEAKLADFGLAYRLGQKETRLTREGGIVGTLGYLSPEQLLGREASPRSDLYAVGVVLFEMLTGKLPYEAASDLGLRLAALAAAAPDVRRLRPEVPRWLAEIIARLLERRPADRFPSAEAVLAVLGKRAVPPRFRLRRWLLRAAAVALLFLPQTGVLITQVQGPRFSHLVPAGETGIKALSDTGETLWTKAGVAPEIADRWALARLTPGGPRLIAIVLARPQEWSPEAISTLSFLDPQSGKIIKQVKLPSGANYFPNDPPRFSFSSAKAVDLFKDGVDEIIVNYSHVPEAPFYAVLYAPRYDQARIVFYARGGQDFQGAADLDGDGIPELLFAGVNNGWNWVNAVAAVRIDPRSLAKGDRMATPAAPDAMVEPPQERFLLWYAIVPRGHLEGPSCLTIDEKRRELTVHYLSGKTWILGFDGFPPGEPSADRAERQGARRDTYQHFWEAERLRRAGDLNLAMSEVEAALDSARRAHETWLEQYAERLRAKLLVAQGRVREGDALFAAVATRAEDAPEVAYDAAVAFHLQGDLPRAVTWYERGIGRESAPGAGKSKHEFLKGEVLALVEEKHYAEALSAVARFGATYPNWQAHLWIFREFVRWRAGERPDVALSVVPPNWTDLERYWSLEFALAEGGKPAEILPQVDRFLDERPETRDELLSLRAELLGRLGHAREAAAVGQSALELVRAEQTGSIVARGHAELVEERARELRAHSVAP
ncbi:MAG TPA: serine/threonine-protein kinase [Thermoanaerobaculia bacterium]|nr:serine/threonine-protein kinase [Thermoanaerobaculia bacterium]